VVPAHTVQGLKNMPVQPEQGRRRLARRGGLRGT